MSGESFPLWFPFVFVGGWVGISVLLSWIGGWRELARHYRATLPFTGQRFWMKSAGMRWGVAYSRCLNLGSDSTGLFLSVVPLFRIGQPPLLVPWSDVSISRQRGWLLGGVSLRFNRAPSVSLLIPAKLATRVLANGPLRLDAELRGHEG
jgi:hypothetical protein